MSKNWPRTCIIPSSQRIHTLNEAIEKTERVFKRELRKKQRPGVLCVHDATANHPLLSYEPAPGREGSFGFEKSDLLVPIDAERRVPIVTLVMVAAAQAFEQVILVGNRMKSFIAEQVKETMGETGRRIVYAQDIPKYSRRMRKERGAPVRDGGVVANIVAGFEAAGRPERFFMIASDLPNITPEDFEGMRAVTEEAYSGEWALVFVNSRENSFRTRFPRSYSPFWRRVPETGRKSSIKEGNAFVFDGRMLTERRHLALMQTVYNGRKLLQPEGLLNLGRVLTHPLLLGEDLLARRLFLRAHTFDNLVWDIDSVEDLVLQHYRKWDKTGMGEYETLVSIAERFQDRATVRGTIYEDYDARFQEHLSLFRVPAELRIGFLRQNVKSYRSDVLYHWKAFLDAREMNGK